MLEHSSISITALSPLQLAGCLCIIWQLSQHLTLIAAKQQIMNWVAPVFTLRRVQPHLVGAALISHTVTIIRQDVCMCVCFGALAKCVLIFLQGAPVTAASKARQAGDSVNKQITSNYREKKT